ncbi:MAG: ABC transporter ATP-binding protein [Pirellulales bacterium]|nr:ABC transporter ATP-binding protein [Pirellulales bacterium]
MTSVLADDRRADRRIDCPVVLRSVGKSFGRGATRSVVLQDVDLELRAGQATFLVGPSGSGKTTLLSIIGCVLTADCGQVELFGRDVSKLAPESQADLRRNSIGFVFQRMHLIRGLSAVENVSIPLMLAGWRTAAARPRSVDLLSSVGLADRADDSPATMSVGQCQRIALARALATDPSLVLADEPTASLDAEAGRAAMELLMRMTVAAGKTLVVVTHDHRILHYADRVLAVDHGRLQEQASTGPDAALRAFDAPGLCSQPPRAGRRP